MSDKSLALEKNVPIPEFEMDLCVPVPQTENTQQQIKTPGLMQKDANISRAIVKCYFTTELEL